MVGLLRIHGAPIGGCASAAKMLARVGTRHTEFEALSANSMSVMTQTPTSEASQTPSLDSILEKAKRIFPIPYQWQIDAWVHMFGEERRDVLVIAGTGSGKSFIFYCLHFAKEGGITLIISPLSALMKDQVL